MRRRSFLATAGTAATLSVAGCGGASSSGGRTLVVGTYGSFIDSPSSSPGAWLKDRFESEFDARLVWQTPSNEVTHYIERAAAGVDIEAALYMGVGPDDLVLADQELDSALFAPAGGVEGQDELSALIEDRTRPGELMPVFEDEHGTYIMNSKDLRAVQHVPELARMGVTSLKIEGRTKSHYYVARTAQVYRRAIDDAVAGRPFDMRLMDELDNLANRGYTEGFYRRHVHDEYQNYQQGNSIGVHQQFVGEVTAYYPERGVIEIEVKNRFEVGDNMELMLPGGNRRFTLEHIENRRGESVSAAPGSGHVVRIPVPGDAIAPERIEFALLMRDLS